MKSVLGLIAGAALVSAPAFAQSSYGTWNDLPDRFRVDTGYFRLTPTTVLRYNPVSGTPGDIELEDDLGLDSTADTFWLDGSWRVGRRHELKLGYTKLSREVRSHTLERDISWGGEVYRAGLGATSTSTTKLLGGYYRFAIVRNDRFEIGPAIGIGYIWLDARIQATATVSGPGGDENRSLDESGSTSSITGAIGGYANAWLSERLVARGDFLYIKVKPGEDEAAVTDWRVGADYYFFRSNAGVGVQYKFNRYSYDRGILANKLGGEVTYKGFQVFVSFLF